MTDSSRSAAERLKVIAEAEQHQQASSRAKEKLRYIPSPPGVEGYALLPRERSDPRAFLSLSDALATFLKPLHTTTRKPQAAIERNPEDSTEALKLYVQAKSAAHDQRYLQAITALVKANDLDPNSTSILRELARCYVAVGNNLRAVEIYEQLIQVEPADSEAVFVVAVTAANRRDFERAVALVAPIRSQGGSFKHDSAADILIDFTLSIALRELGYDTASIEVGLRAVDVPGLVNMNTQYAARIGSVYRRRGEVWRAIGDAYCRLQEYEKALDAYSKSESLPSTDPSALYARIMYTNMCLGRFATAQHVLLRRLQDAASEVIDRDIRLCEFIREHIESVELLAEAVTSLYQDSPDDSGLVRAAASLLPAEKAQVILREFVRRRPRDVDGVWQLLTWLAERDVSSAVSLTLSLSQDHPDLAEEYVDRLAVAVPRPAQTISALRSMDDTQFRSFAEARVLAKVSALGEAWSVCVRSRSKWADDLNIRRQQVQLAGALSEPMLLKDVRESIETEADAETWIALSQSYRAVQDFENSVEAAQQATVLEPESARALVELAISRAVLAASLVVKSSQAQQARAEADMAVRFAEMALSLDDTNESAYALLLSLYGQGGVLQDLDLFRQTINRMSKAVPDSRVYGHYVAREEISLQRYEQAIDRLLNLYEADLSDQESVRLAVAAWERWGRLESAEKWLLERLESRPGDPALLEQWIQVLIRQRRADEAMTRLENDLANQPGDYATRGLLEGLYRQLGFLDSALPLAEERLLARPAGVKRELELAAMYADVELADRALGRLAWVRDYVSEVRVIDLVSAVNIAGRLRGGGVERDELILEIVREGVNEFEEVPVHIYAEGIRALARLNQIGDEFDELALKAALSSQSRQLNEDQRSPQEEAESFHPWRNLAQGLVDDGFPSAAAHVMRIRYQNSRDMSPQVRAGIVRLALVADIASAKLSDPELHADHSIELLQTLIHENVNELDAQKNEMLLTMNFAQQVQPSDAYFRLSNWYANLGCRIGAEHIQQHVLTLNPDHAMALNNLGYSRLDRGLQDERTVHWIEEAIALAPDDPNILDTIGWLRYMQGQLKDAPATDPDGQPQLGALTLIQKSINAAPDISPEVYDHLGDVHWRLGNVEEAQEAWKHVIEFLTENEFGPLMIREYEINQQRLWLMSIVDPHDLYEHHFTPILERASEKLAATERGDEPPVASIFSEVDVQVE